MPIIRNLLRHPLLRFLPLVSVLAAGTGMSAASFFWSRDMEQRRLQAEFDSHAGEIEAVLSRRVGATLEVLTSIERLYAASQEVDAEEFELFTRHALSTYPSIGMLGWAGKRIEGGEERLVLEILAPATAGTLAGIDLKSIPACAAAMDEAIKANASRATAPLELSSPAASSATRAGAPNAAGESRFDSLIFLPVYGRKPDPAASEAALNHERLRGFAVSGLKLDRLLQSALRNVNLRGQEIQLLLPASGDGVSSIYRSAGDAREPRADLKPWRRVLPVAGQEWQLVGVPTTAYRGISRAMPVWLVPAVGMTFTILLGAYLHTLGNRTARVEALVARRTTDLEGANRDLERAFEERRRTEAALIESEQRHRAVVQQAADGITLVDAETLWIIEVNEAFARLLGYTQQELVGRPIFDFIVETPQGVAARARQTLGAASPTVTARQYRRKDGSTVDVEKSATVLQIGGRRVLCTVVHDITERKLAEEAIRRSEEQTRLIVETALDAFIAMDQDGRIQGWNAQAEKTFGWPRDEAIGRLLAETIIPVQYRQAHAAGISRFLETGEGPLLNMRVEVTALRRDGSEFPAELTIAPLHAGEKHIFNAFVHDITDRRRREHELQEKHRQLEEAIEKLKLAQGALVQSEKLAGIGQMVAGVAHEINNPLAFVSNNVAVLQRDVRGLCEVLDLYSGAEEVLAEHRAELLGQIKALSERMDLDYTRKNLETMMTRSREGLGRIQQIVKDLREFARLDKGGWQETVLNAGVESTINIVRGLARKKQVTLDLQLGEIPPIACNSAKINQVMMNLVTNAIDASQAGGTVTLRTAHDAAADAVLIEVIDQGAGIAPDILQRIFDPFFTTKDVGKGTGLGLSISYGIVKEHGGSIDVESEVGKGSKFTVTLPRRRPGAVDHDTPASPAGLSQPS